MEFNIDETVDILERTPFVLEMLLKDLNEKWIFNNEGVDTWSPYDVMGHLIHGEKTDWVPRMMIILKEKDGKFVPFDRSAQFVESKGKTLSELLAEFTYLRRENISILKQLSLTNEVLNNTGIHPEFGEVTLRQLLATWVVHDLAHINQISRVMAKQYEREIGPWVKYFSVFNPKN